MTEFNPKEQELIHLATSADAASLKVKTSFYIAAGLSWLAALLFLAGGLWAWWARDDAAQFFDSLIQGMFVATLGTIILLSQKYHIEVLRLIRKLVNQNAGDQSPRD